MWQFAISFVTNHTINIGLDFDCYGCYIFSVSMRIVLSTSKRQLWATSHSHFEEFLKISSKNCSDFLSMRLRVRNSPSRPKHFIDLNFGSAGILNDSHTKGLMTLSIRHSTEENKNGTQTTPSRSSRCLWFPMGLFFLFILFFVWGVQCSHTSSIYTDFSMNWTFSMEYHNAKGLMTQPCHNSNNLNSILNRRKEKWKKFWKSPRTFSHGMFCILLIERQLSWGT